MLLQRTTPLLPSRRRTLKSEDGQAIYWGDPCRKRLLESNGPACKSKRRGPYILPADGEEPTSVKSVRYQYTVKIKQHVLLTLLCTLDTTESILLKGRLAFRERTSNHGWRAFVTDPTWLCRHDIPTTASIHLHSLPLTTSNSNFQTCSPTVPMHVLGAAPIKALFLRGTYIRNYTVKYKFYTKRTLPCSQTTHRIPQP